MQRRAPRVFCSGALRARRSAPDSLSGVGAGSHMFCSLAPALSRHTLRQSPLPSCTTGILTINQLMGLPIPEWFDPT